MSCPDHQTISAFADGELEAGQAAEAERHIVQCAGCRQLMEEMRWVDDCGRAALGAIRVGESTAANIVWWKPPPRNWVRPLSLAAVAAVVFILSIGTWIASNYSSRHQTAPASSQVTSAMATPTGSDGLFKETEDAAFERWAVPYRELHIPLVPMEVAESYNPDPILPILPNTIEMNR